MSEPEPMVSIRVRVLNREYPLRVAPGDEDYTLHLAQRVDERMRKLQHAIPTQTDLTHAVLTALELAEELYATRAEVDRLQAHVEIETGHLADRLDQALATPTPREPSDET